jgi:putative tricarboxylic transport membrane protein
LSGDGAGGTPAGVPCGAGGAVKTAPYVTRRTLEISTAIACALLGATVAAESLTHDIGWNETGPGSGYFPFRVGALIIGAAAVLLFQNVAPAFRGKTTDAVFVTGDEFARTLSVFLPTVLLVAAMTVLGCYVPAAAYLAWMMRRHGGRSWLTAIGYGVAMMVTFFLIFDVWFKVPLAKGPVEAALGLY